MFAAERPQGCPLPGRPPLHQAQQLLLRVHAEKPSGEPIEGLYVAGVDSGSYYAHTYPNMSTGNCCGRSVTFARMIGKALAAK